MLTAVSRTLRKAVTRQRVMLGIGVWCLSQAAILLLHNQFFQLTDQSTLDLRAEGYQEADVRTLLHDAGAQGRQIYLWISLLDTCVYMWSYAWLLSALLTMASAVAPVEAFKLFNVLPFIAVLVDAVENVLTLSMLLTYPNLVDSLAPVLPSVSRVKWFLLFACASLVGGSGFYCLAVAAGLAGGRKKRDRDGTTAAAGAASPQPKGRQTQRSGSSRKRA